MKVKIIKTEAYVPEDTGVSRKPPCLGLGSPSPDRRIRSYTKQDCDTLNGNFAGNGECLRKEGGSFSWECRFLNGDNLPN
jgi:hypothetical protein